MINSLHYLIPALFLFWGTGYFADDPTPKPEGEMRIESVYVEPIIVSNIEYNVVEAMIQVESAGKDSAYNASEDAVGCLQIRPIMIKDVNRILSRKNIKKRFKIKDRFNRSKAIQMFKIWKDHYHKKSSFEKIARCWNGGTKGHNMKATIKYWQKVQSYNAPFF